MKNEEKMTNQKKAQNKLMIKAELMINCFYLMHYIILGNLIVTILVNEIGESKDSYIILKINKAGNISIFYSGNNVLCREPHYPDIVEIYGV